MRIPNQTLRYRWWGLVLLLLLSLPTGADAQSPSASGPSALETAEQLFTQNLFDQAAEAALQLDTSTGEKDRQIANRHLILLARLGRSAQKSDNDQSAVQLYERAIDVANLAGSLDVDFIAPKLCMLHLARVSVAGQLEDDERILDSLEKLASLKSPLNQSQATYIAKTAIGIGGRKLSKGDWQAAATAYQVAEQLGDPSQVATAMLGSAWSLVISENQPARAADRLSQFLERYPDHPDATQAMRVYARCLTELGEQEKARQKLRELITRWPDSPSALQVVQSHMDLPAAQLPDEVRDWLHHHSKTSGHKNWSAKMTAFALEVVFDASDEDVRDTLVLQLMATDQTGSATTRLLDRVSYADAESIATQYLSPPKSKKIFASVREAACRWAGRHQNWSLIAGASQRESPEQVTPGRTVTIERLFAESLMQLGRTKDALVWWNHVTDERNATDFSTLLRCAEAEISVGNKIERAQQRLAAARQAAQSTFAITLVDLLEAELAIRRSRFDSARSLLENVVRGPEIDANLRSRAQWLIGETFFLQQQFPAAIDAYRQVEGIEHHGPVDADNRWVAAAFVQAGKAFEQLGRTREASVCYGNLLRRFADSPHAEVARHRMAAINPDLTSPSTGSIRR